MYIVHVWCMYMPWNAQFISKVMMYVYFFGVIIIFFFVWTIYLEIYVWFVCLSSLNKTHMYVYRYQVENYSKMLVLNNFTHILMQNLGFKNKYLAYILFPSSIIIKWKNTCDDKTPPQFPLENLNIRHLFHFRTLALKKPCILYSI